MSTHSGEESPHPNPHPHEPSISLQVSIREAHDLPITEDAPCRIRLLKEPDESPTDQPSHESPTDQSSTEQSSQRYFESALLVQPNAPHVQLRATFTIPAFTTPQQLNSILDGSLSLFRIQIIREDQTPLGEASLNLAALLEQKDTGPISLRVPIQSNQDQSQNTADAKKKQKKPAKEKDVPQQPQFDPTTIIYSIKIVSSQNNLIPQEQKEHCNFVTFQMGPLVNLPPNWLKSIKQAKDDQKQQLIDNHLFEYCARIQFPSLDSSQSFTISGGRLAIHHEQSQEDQEETFAIVWDSPKTCYIPHSSPMRELLFAKEPLQAQFSRRIRSSMKQDSWEDFNAEKYTANILFDLSPLLKPGQSKCSVEASLQPVEPPPDQSTDDPKKGGKKADKKPAPKIKGLPEELLPESDESPHPFIANETKVEGHISFSRPLIPFAKDRIRPDQHIEDLIEKRSPISKKTSSTEKFEKNIDTIARNLIKQYAQSYNQHANGKERFIFDLNQNGSYFSFKEELKNSVNAIVQEKFASPHMSKENMESLYSQVFIYLTERTNYVLKNIYANSEDGKPEFEQEDILNRNRRLAKEAELENKYDTATEFFQECVQMHPNQTELWYQYALFCLRIRDVSRAEFCLKECLSLDMSHELALFDYGVVLMSLNRYKESAVILHSLLDCDPQHVDGWVLLSLLHELNDEEKLSEDALNQARVLKQGDENIFISSIRYILFVLHIDTIAERLIQRSSSETIEDMKSQIHYFKGQIYTIREDYERAEEQLRQATERDIRFVDAWKLLGDIHFAQNHYIDAKQAYETCVSYNERDVDDPQMCIRLGRLYAELGEYEESRVMFSRATELWPCGLSWLGLGVAYFGIDDLGQAEQAWNEANVLDNSNAETWAWLCVLNGRCERVSTGTQCWLQVERLGGVKSLNSNITRSLLTNACSGSSMEEFETKEQWFEANVVPLARALDMSAGNGARA